MEICSNFYAAYWLPSPFSPTIISLIFSLCFTVVSRFHFCTSSCLFYFLIESISPNIFYIFFSNNAILFSPSFLTFSICSFKLLIYVSLIFVFFLAKAVCIYFFTFNICTSLIIEDSSSIKACFLSSSRVSSVTLILLVLILPITSIFNWAFSMIFEFFSSISDLPINRASSSWGTGVSLLI